MFDVFQGSGFLGFRVWGLRPLKRDKSFRASAFFQTLLP